MKYKDLMPYVLMFTACSIMFSFIMFMEANRKPEVVTQVYPTETIYEPSVVVEDVPKVEVIVEPAEMNTTPEKLYDIPMDAEMQCYVHNVCEEYDIEDSIVFAVIEKESQYATDAVNSSGTCVGLMQVAPKWHKDRMKRLGIDNPIEPHNNVCIGVDYLAELSDKYEDVEMVLMAYNMGEGRAKKCWKKGIYTTNYVKKVLSIQEKVLDAQQ